MIPVGFSKLSNGTIENGREGTIVIQRFLGTCATLGLAAGLCAHAYAGGSSPASFAADGGKTFSLTEEPAKPAPFSQGSTVLQTTASYMTGKAGDNYHAFDMEQLGLGLGYYLRDNFAITGELAGYYTRVDGYNDPEAWGGGFNLNLRYHFLNYQRFSMFADIAGGVLGFQNDWPPGGTHFNFTARAGVGATYQLCDRAYLIGGTRFFHLSNGDRHGNDQNPSANGWEFYTGLLFPL